MGDLSTYSIVDFIPVTRSVYLRLFTRLNEAYWPLQIALLVVGAAAVWLAYRGRGRPACLLMAIGWVCSGWAYHLEMYAQLNWAALYVGWAFIIQGAAFALTALTDIFERPAGDSVDVRRAPGLAVAFFGLTCFPLLGPLAGRGWPGGEWFGLAPDPTAVATLGMLLLARRPPWWLVPIPVVWALLSMATSYGLETFSGYVTGGIALAAVVWAVANRVLTGDSR